MNPHVDPEESLGFALKRLQQTLRSRMDAALAQVGLTTPQYLALALLEDHPGISNSELARRSAVAAPTMLKILDALAKAGYIERADRVPRLRTRGTTLTTSGRDRLARASATVKEFEILLRGAAGADEPVISAWLRTCTGLLAEAPATRDASASPSPGK
ncbi:MarR family winged helix-turn-helix transcriptional regulator [Streptomyces malaysiensis]|uniref:MarR family transcriptional regulator n=1 Tax=Streptomyces malaysiensis subsp. samsunensis TaxID=459658 RepID=A0A9X2LZ45_STRMQ|nr:MarR family transcriptional regulator [Streptomyces samsunensis]MCQ8832176.1 MarR family transcriptional regulator [Streptomyces samsunensis]